MPFQPYPLSPNVTTTLTSSITELWKFKDKLLFMAWFFCPKMCCYSRSFSMAPLKSFLITHEVSQLFMFIGSLYIFFCEALFVSFFIISLFYWLLELFYISKTQVFSGFYIYQISFPPLSCLVTLIMFSSFFPFNSFVFVTTFWRRMLFEYYVCIHRACFELFLNDFKTYLGQLMIFLF